MTPMQSRYMCRENWTREEEGKVSPKCPDSGLGAWDRPSKWAWEISTHGLGIEGWSVGNFLATMMKRPKQILWHLVGGGVGGLLPFRICLWRINPPNSTFPCHSFLSCFRWPFEIPNVGCTLLLLPLYTRDRQTDLLLLLLFSPRSHHNFPRKSETNSWIFSHTKDKAKKS
jgi:hypothetical protein